MRDSIGFRIFRAVVLAALAVFVLFPVYIAVTAALKPLADVTGTFSWIPQQATIQPFLKVWPDLDLGLGFKNSLIVMLATTVIATPIAVAAAFAISRYTFFGRRAFLAATLSTQVFPGLLFLIPLYLVFLKVQNMIGIQLVGTYTGLIITYLSFSLPLSTWILVGIIGNFPRDLEEAAMIDGLTEISAFIRVVLPSITGAIAAVAMFACVTAWSEVLFASVLTTSSTQTLGILLSNIVAAPGQIVKWNELMAAAIYASIPIVAAFYAVQRQFVTGLTAGAMKG
jgi:multiple sugar transport system permease protein